MSNDRSSENLLTKYSSYPRPEAEYQEILRNRELFLQKLGALHVFYGSKFRIPVIGGNRLDLHQLFVEVTSRGGIEKVLSERKWKEVTGVFKFPSSVTNASFVLRKFYLSLLYHFEQVYYFRKERPSNSAVVRKNGTRSTLSSTPACVVSDQFSVSPSLEDGSFITGTIDGKFDHGYLVTVNLRNEELRGVLYHAPVASNSPLGISSPDDIVRHPWKKHQMASRDPSRPKRNRSGYTFFFAEHYHRLQPSYIGQEKGISKKIGEMWNELLEAEKQVYQEKGLQDKERYQAELLDYKSSHQELSQ